MIMIFLPMFMIVLETGADQFHVFQSQGGEIRDNKYRQKKVFYSPNSCNTLVLFSFFIMISPLVVVLEMCDS